MLLWPGPVPPAVTFGRYLTTSSKFCTLSCSIVSPVSACIAIGTFWMFSSRRWAVTMTSCSWLPGAALGLGGAAGSAARADLAAIRQAATAASIGAERRVRFAGIAVPLSVRLAVAQLRVLEALRNWFVIVLLPRG